MKEKSVCSSSCLSLCSRAMRTPFTARAMYVVHLGIELDYYDLKVNVFLNNTNNTTKNNNIIIIIIIMTYFSSRERW